MNRYLAILLVLIILATYGCFSSSKGETETLGPPNYLQNNPDLLVISSPLNRTYDSKTILVNFTVTNSMAVYDVGYSVDGGTIWKITNLVKVSELPIVNGTLEEPYDVTYSGRFTVDNISEGSHYLVIYHGYQQKVVWQNYQPTQEPGKYDIISYRRVDFTIDTTAPSITVLEPQGTYNSTQNIEIKLITNEPTAWIGYSLDNQVNVTINGNTTMTNLSAGSHRLQVFANDTAGNVGASSISNFTINKETSVNYILYNQESLVILVIVIVIVTVASISLVYFKKHKHNT